VTLLRMFWVIMTGRMCSAARVSIGVIFLECVFSAAMPSLPDCCSYASSMPAAWASSASVEPSLERELLRLVNRDRKEQGLAPLALDVSLASIARDHSRQMALQEVVSHDLKGSGDLETRLDRAGYLRRVARENVASAATIDQAQSALMKSPGHRRNLLATDVTHVGLGVVRGQDSGKPVIYVTQIFARLSKRLQATDVLQFHLSRVAEMRRRSGHAPLSRDSTLDGAAANALGALSAPAGKGTLKHLAGDALARVPKAGIGGLSSMTADVQLIRDESDLQIAGALRDASARMIGAAAREVPDERGRPVIVIVSLVGLQSR